MNSVSLLRVFTWLEGSSYLLLLLVAMPLKYVWELPMAVRVLGGVHGLLFLGFALVLYQTHVEHKWSPRHSLSLFVAALVPGCLWWLDRRIRSGRGRQAGEDEPTGGSPLNVLR